MPVNVRPFSDKPPTTGREILVFAHANGYPPGSYRLLLTRLSEYVDVYVVDHRPLWSDSGAPRRLAWSIYADDLIGGLTAFFDGPVWLCGHSMGAVVSVLAAHQRPDLVKGLLALDPVLFPRRLWLAAQFMTRVLRQELPICKVALNRPHCFDNHTAAFDFYRAKRPFRRLSDEALWDYVKAGHRQASDGGVQLVWSGAWEACVYRSAPSIFGVLAQINQPMLGIAGIHSDVLGTEILAKWQRCVPQVEQHVLPGGHLIPLEMPDECAQRRIDFIQRA